MDFEWPNQLQASTVSWLTWRYISLNLGCSCKSKWWWWSWWFHYYHSNLTFPLCYLSVRELLNFSTTILWQLLKRSELLEWLKSKCTGVVSLTANHVSLHLTQRTFLPGSFWKWPVCTAFCPPSRGLSEADRSTPHLSTASAGFKMF